MSVKVRQVTKRFGLRGEVVGVNDVDFEAPEHAITSLLGPSGSGKSTLLRIVAGLEVPDSGSVQIAGVDVTRIAVRRREVGFVFQNYALFRHMTVAENVAFGLSVRKAAQSAIKERVAELLNLVQLGGYERRFPDQLSGGQRQRVALARAMATNPRVLLLDEPFGALDTRVRVELREWLHRLHEKTQVTTLLVTHDQEEALELSEHVVLLRNGRVEQSGSPTELYENPANGFVASFLGGAKILKGSVERGRASFAEQSLSTSVDLADGAVVEAFVRPHDIGIEKIVGPATVGQVATVSRLVRVGSFVKLSIALPDGDSISVQMPRRECDERGLREGDRVRLDLRDVKVAPPMDYVI
ncbi:MAG TPA: TOBE-like domain-containing protein [Polyangiaceae bacterium]|jgi:sulfate transport system ATP-binding protein|nr:TOBE-like domain-containing protein [Polyangiaceae bacterium]